MRRTKKIAENKKSTEHILARVLRAWMKKKKDDKNTKKTKAYHKYKTINVQTRGDVIPL